MISENDRIVLVHGESGDWEGLYLNDIIVNEGHSLDVSDVLRELGIKHRCETVVVGRGGRLPAHFGNVLSVTARQRQRKLAEVERLREQWQYRTMDA